MDELGTGEHGSGDGSEDDGLSRRTLLRVGLAALAASVLTAGAIEAGAAVVRNQAPSSGQRPTQPGSPDARLTAGHPSSPTATSSATSRAGTPTSSATSSPTPSPTGTNPTHTSSSAQAARPLWATTWDDPIRQLDGYVQHRVGERYPRRAVMLTVDDGPHPVWTPKYLRLFEKYEVSATFNVIGEQVRPNRALLKAMVSQGHHIGNHTFHHPLNLPYLSARTIRHELEDTTDAVVRACGFRPRQFRAPGGVWGADVFAEAARQQMMPLGWDIDPRDWALPGIDAIQDAMLAARPHDIILCHDGGGDRSETYHALQKVIPELLARGYEFVTLPAPQ